MPPTSKRDLVCVAGMMVTTQAIFGVYAPIVKTYKGHMNTLWYSMLRDLCATPLLLATAAVTEGGLHTPSCRELPFFAALGVVGMFGAQYLNILGIIAAGAETASVMQPTIPLFTAALAVASGWEAAPHPATLAGAARLLGVVCGCGGAVVMLVAKPGCRDDTCGTDHETCSGCCKGGGGGVNAGLLLLIGNCMCVAAYMVLMRYIFDAGPAAGDCAAPSPASSPTASPAAKERARSEARSFLSRARTDEGSCSAYSSAYGPIVARQVDDESAAGYPVPGLRGLRVARWRTRPIHVTAWSYCFGAGTMGVAMLYYVVDGVRQHQVGSEVRDAVWVGALSTIPLAYAVVLTSALCYALFTLSSARAPSSVVTAFWPAQVPVAIFAASLMRRVPGRPARELCAEGLAPAQAAAAAAIACSLLLFCWGEHRTRADAARAAAAAAGSDDGEAALPAAADR